MTINRALGYKWDGDQEKAKQIILQEDWSATMTKFRLAEAVIRDEYDTVYLLMREIGKDSLEIPIFHYRNWPLFKAIRKEAKFLEVFQEIFGEPYEKVEIQPVKLPENVTDNVE